MRVGDLRDRVSVEVRTEVSDGHDGFIETWAVRLSRLPARVRELSGRDLEIARQVDPRTSIEVDFRYWRAFRDDLDGGRAQLKVHETSSAVDDRTLEIVSPPIETERRVKVTVGCRESV
jgi:head-tail adaptor